MVKCVLQLQWVMLNYAGEYCSTAIKASTAHTPTLVTGDPGVM